MFGGAVKRRIAVQSTRPGRSIATAMVVHASADWSDQHLERDEGLPRGEALVVRGSLERLVPVAMTALSAGLGLIPLALASGEPGKEMLGPVAIVVLGGLVSSTLAAVL